MGRQANEEQLQVLRDLAAQGVSQKEAAEMLGKSKQTIHNAAARHGIEFEGVREKDGLTKEQRRDVYTLIDRAGYSYDEARRIVTAPKVKIRATPKEVSQ